MNKLLLTTLTSMTLVTCVACNGPIPSGYPTVIKFVPVQQTGPTLLDRVEALEDRMSYAESRLTTLETQRIMDYAALETALEITTADITRLESLLNTHTDSIGLINNQIFLMDQRIADIVFSIEAIQQQQINMQAELAQLQTHMYISEIVDPCGNHPSKVDEVLLRMSTGQLVVFFTDAGNDRLSILVAGSYVTTDGTSCHFSVDSSNNIVYP